MKNYKVHKFGGSSLADTERLNCVYKIILAEHDGLSACVLSAMGGVTDKLVQIAELASAEPKISGQKSSELFEHFESTAKSFLSAENSQKFLNSIEKDFEDLKDILKSISIVKECSENNHDYIVGLGEVWTAQLMAAKFVEEGKNCEWIDAREVLVVKEDELGKSVDYDSSGKNLGNLLGKAKAEFYIITGFVARTKEGAITTLGRNGSDFSASIFGNLLNADSVSIWTDVDGVMSGDPRKVPEARVIDNLTYQEATELAYFGAKVVHLKTMLPALEKKIPIWIKNTFNPGAKGTRIGGVINQEMTKESSRIKGFTTINKIALLNVEGTGMIGVPGIAARLFGAMNENNISVVLISQASSEYSICFAIPEAQVDAARKCAEEAFFGEISQGKIERIEIEKDCCILAAVGDQMVGTIGVSAKLFSALSKAGVNIRAIAQGSSERNISVVIKDADSTKALNAAHSAFYLSSQTFSLGLIGPGVVGGTLLNQLNLEISELKEKHNLDIRVRGITNSRKMILDEKNLILKDWESSLENSTVEANISKFVEHIKTDFIPHTVLIDCTTSEVVAKQYNGWLEKGIHVITPNKKAATFPIEEYLDLKAKGASLNSHFLYETTVGAGLPVIGTLQELVRTGDEILQIEGVLSGTLAYLFYHFDGTRAFSEIVREAKEKGFTEPDPRDDLSGMDIVRKVVILAREIGLDIEIEDVEVSGLVPKELENVSIDEFLDGLSKYDDEYKDKVAEAISKGQVLRYVGIIEPNGKSRVELKTYEQSHPFSRIKATDNIVAFRTKRYDEQPLIVQGPGAGPAVTAAGVFADLLKLARYTGSRL
ncbi:MAG: bifunctional aspartate kinase/homoserine dehydrogenase I [Halobacteriovorax sp.]|nr:bifunctional aspartate kinase/homoserine dehydrogenase I [Halobacteriovorax sp.]|tara:strand:+ start:59299 stop:61779 length:2481 start_codon:yes stop_codon:yes gene_type:complete